MNHHKHPRFFTSDNFDNPAVASARRNTPVQAALHRLHDDYPEYPGYPPEPTRDAAIDWYWDNMTSEDMAIIGRLGIWNSVKAFTEHRADVRAMDDAWYLARTRQNLRRTPQCRCRVTDTTGYAEFDLVPMEPAPESAPDYAGQRRAAERKWRRGV